MLIIERDPPVDFAALLLDLVRMGWSLAGIARAVNVPNSTLRRWWGGDTQPMYENGRALIKLHAHAAARRKAQTASAPPR